MGYKNLLLILVLGLPNFSGIFMDKTQEYLLYHGCVIYRKTYVRYICTYGGVNMGIGLME